MRVMALHRKKNLKNVANELTGTEEVWVVGKQTPDMQKAIELAKMMNIPVHYNPFRQETEDRLFK